MPAEPIRVRVTVQGVVQGVGFRVAAERAAREAGVGGWVRNLPDGSVEAAVEGPPEGVERMLAFLGQGPPAAVVDRIERAPERPAGEASFEVRG